MTKIRVLVVEDQLLIAEDISHKLRNNNLEIVGVCESGEEAIEMIKKANTDIVLMDINLAGDINGIETAELINEHNEIPIIYLTDYSDKSTIDKAKQTFPANYIVKPFLEEDLVRAIEIACYNAAFRSKNNSNNSILDNCLFLRTDKQQFIKLKYDEILYIEAHRAYCEVWVEGQKYTFSKNMKNIYEQIDHPDFIKVHKSYVVNVNRISEINGNQLILGEHKIQMSQEYRKEVMSKLKFLK